MKKVLIADNAAPIANEIFSNYDQYGGPILFVGAIFFAFQIYGDFSGYSDMAVGLGLLFGLRLPINFNLPYKDETITSIFTADGTSKIYDLDFTPTSINEFEVFVGGKRLRKTMLQSYELDSSNRTNYATSEQKISQDSPEGDVTLPAQFSLQNENELVLLDVPLENTKVIVVRRKGQIWNESGKTLSNSNTDIARFLLSTQVDLPR